MFDSRLQKLAQIMVNQSLAVAPGDKVHLKLHGVAGLPLARLCHAAIIDAGGLPLLQLFDEQMEEYYLTFASKKQLQAKPEFALYQAKYFDKTLQIVAESNVNQLTNVAPATLLARARLTQPVRQLTMAKPWVMAFYPTPALAQAAKLSLRELEDYIFTAIDQDYQAMSRLMRRLAQVLTNQDLRIVGHRTDLTLTTQGHRWITDDWKCNLPGGEVFTSPVIDSLQGHIYFDFPLSRQGKTMTDIYLEFRQGKVINAQASQHQDFLHTLLQTDAGAHFVGEIAFGLNQNCDRYLDNVIYDEKMAGTIHLALGAGFPECGPPVNQSALHLDIIKDMRLPGSKVWAGQKLILENGQLHVT